MSKRPRLLLETSEALTYIDPGEDTDGAAAVEKLLEYSEAGRIELAMARAGWNELEQREGERRQHRLERLRHCVRQVGNVIRKGEWILGVDMLGSSVAPYVDLTLPPGASRPDRDQFLVHESGGYDFLVTNDRKLRGHQPRMRIS